MKRIFLAFTLLMLSPGVHAQKTNTPVGGFNEFAAQATANNKPYCVEVRAQWCGVCRMFERETLSDPKVKDFFSRTFAFAQVDADAEGDAFRKKYKIKSYPVILFFYPNGELIGRINGFQDADYFQFNAEGFYRKFCKKYDIPLK